MAVLLDRPYCTLEDVQKEARNQDTDLDDWIVTCINLASRFVDDYCNRDFWFHDHSEGEETFPLYVPRPWVMGDKVFLPWPIITLTKIWVYSDHVVGKTDNDLLEAKDFMGRVGDYVISCESGEFAPYPFSLNMEIEGTFGLAVTDEETPPALLPPHVRRATALIAANFSVENSKQVIGLDGNAQELLDTSVPGEAKMLLRRWRNLISVNF